MKEVKAYKSDDGYVFESKEDCLKQEFQLELKEILESTGLITRSYASEFLSFIYDARNNKKFIHDFSNVLKKLADNIYYEE